MNNSVNNNFVSANVPISTKAEFKSKKNVQNAFIRATLEANKLGGSKGSASWCFEKLSWPFVKIWQVFQKVIHCLFGCEVKEREVPPAKAPIRTPRKNEKASKNEFQSPFGQTQFLPYTYVNEQKKTEPQAYTPREDKRAHIAKKTHECLNKAVEFIGNALPTIELPELPDITPAFDEALNGAMDGASRFAHRASTLASSIQLPTMSDVQTLEEQAINSSKFVIKAVKDAFTQCIPSPRASARPPTQPQQPSMIHEDFSDAPEPLPRGVKQKAPITPPRITTGQDAKQVIAPNHSNGTSENSTPEPKNIYELLSLLTRLKSKDDRVKSIENYVLSLPDMKPLLKNVEFVKGIKRVFPHEAADLYKASICGVNGKILATSEVVQKLRQYGLLPSMPEPLKYQILYDPELKEVYFAGLLLSDALGECIDREHAEDIPRIHEKRLSRIK